MIVSHRSSMSLNTHDSRRPQPSMSSMDWKVLMPLCKVLTRQHLKACTQFCTERLEKRNSHHTRWGYHKSGGKEQLKLPSMK